MALPSAAHPYVERRCSGSHSVTLDVGLEGKGASLKRMLYAWLSKRPRCRPRRGIVALSRQVHGSRVAG